jgi:hypothetical protein
MILLGMLATAHAGAWTRAQGDYYAKIGADFYRATSYVNPLTGQSTDYAFFGAQQGVYGELGLAKAWPVQLTVHVPVSTGTIRFEDATLGAGVGHATATRIGDVDVALQAEIYGGGPKLAGAVDVKLPAYANDGVGQAFGVYQSLFPKPGDDQVDVTAWLLCGSSVPHTPVWFDSAVGYRHRTETFLGWSEDVAFVDGIPFQLTVGATFGRVIPMIKVDGIGNVQRDDVTREGASVGPAVLITVWKGVALEGRFAADVWSRHAATGLGFGLGVSVRDPV